VLAALAARADADADTAAHAKIFTGNVTAEDHTDIQNTRVRFEAGARTYWHSHAGGQVLVVIEGRGRMQEEGGPIRDMGPGEAIYTKPGRLHWHGAAPDQHAVVISAYVGALDWKQAVTEEEYRGKL
jgi:quercetin dioxygenase-like cupin family protein